ncbi:MAG: hypothetical protein IT442_03360 [Phycisphaeraceae bacterium]|nr:hypothetical protein [Phycisphaeraceae bacterium]
MRFELDLRRSLTPAHHLGVASGHAVVQPLMPTVCGVADVFCPPLLTRNAQFRLAFELDGHPVADDGNYGKGDCGLLYAGGTWNIDRLTRRGTYHHHLSGRLFSMEVVSELVALRDVAGFAIKVTARNRCQRRVTMRIMPMLAQASADVVPLDQWGYCIPPADRPVRATGEHQWSSDAVDMTLHGDNFRSWNLEPGDAATWTLAMTMTRHGEPGPRDFSAAQAFDRTIDDWRGRLHQIDQQFPSLRSDIPGLEDYYNRSLASGLVCLWDRADFVTQPFVATSGMDGGAICCYPWDTTGYPPLSLGLLLGKQYPNLTQAMATFGLDQHNSFALDGTGLSVPYAYNTIAFIQLIDAAARLRGPDRALYEYAAQVFLELESRLTLRHHLADYGVQHNLLEMRQTGYEHYVPSPNAERAWCYRRLAELGDRFGDARAGAWRREADAIIDAVRKHLWSDEAGFFKCLRPDGHEEMVLSIQGFDAIRFGAGTPEMIRAMLGHVREGAFLGEYGVSSVSAEDKLHYELNDPDWSGGGSYTGDGPLLALTLWELGYPTQAWDVLRRHLWMGRHLTYFPQEHYCDRPAVAAHKRANVIAGLSGVETILFGLFGLRFQDNGHACVQSGWPDGLRGTVELRNLVIRGRRVDVVLQNGLMHADDPDRVLRPS